LQTESCSEEPLDDVIIKVARNAPVINQDTEPLLISANKAMAA
jgi:hypothetical protein